MNEVQDLKNVIVYAWFKDRHFTQQGYEAGVTVVATGGTVDTLSTVAATAVQKHYADRIERLSYTLRRLAASEGVDIAKLLELDYIREGDLS